MKTENIEDIYEVSPIQHGILFHSLCTSELSLYFVQLGFTFHGDLNVVAFERAWQRVVDRHTILRTSFYWEDMEKPLQVVYKNVKVCLEQQDWRLIEPDEVQTRLSSFLKRDRERGFDFSQVPLMRLILIRLEDHSYQFIWSTHMLMLDGWSYPLVLKEVIDFYVAFCQGEDVPFQPGSTFRNYITWLRQQDSSTSENFWRQMLKGVKTPTPLSNLDVGNLSNPQERYDEVQIEISKAITADLQSLARQHRLTINVLVQGAWALLLGRYSCRNEVIYGCTVSGRPVDLEGSESMVGEMVNTLPVRVKIDGEQYLMPWLQQLQEQLVEIRQYEYTSLVDIQQWSEIPQGTPLFESIFVFENQPIERILRESQEQNKAINFSRPLNLYKTNYPLNLVGYPGSELRIGISYDFRRFDTATIIGILKHFKILLQNIATNPEVRLKDLSLLTEQEQQLKAMLEKQVTFNFDLALSN
ncbi:condensation domain-containing protein [Nostoc sp. ChiVER01]|uniref:condensation domain-containing protein n=1 Tax=Nostoc sp. ChiVER01 TaxID=3075382 RepID=UPI002AD20116|nr:condensation domain-containing protein [Nostoc sp. ChiVER01]MDZ8228269.1 condensation domain-containing protein [Nostoc sp. ChiVER01]